MLTLLSIAGFDPSSGAGMTADLMVFAAHRCFGTSCATALTVQSTTGVRSVEPVPGRLVSETLACLQDDLPCHGVKIGMLGTAEIVEAVSRFINRLKDADSTLPVVLDPVLRSTSGKALLSAEGLAAMKSSLLPVVDWVTPNLAELEVLTGQSGTETHVVEQGAHMLQRIYPGLGVVVTGGHLEGSADDLVVSPGGRRDWIRGATMESVSTHGTGCAFSSAMLCGLARGLDGRAAAEQAKHYVTGAIQHAVKLGSGNGPLHLLWPLTPLISP